MSGWLAPAPWGPIAAVLIAVGLWMAYSRRGKKSRATLTAKLAAGAKVVDVRTRNEFGAGHYPDAVNIPLDKLPSKLGTLGAKDAPIVVYCASGVRSAQAAALLKRAGFTDVTNAGSLARIP